MARLIDDALGAGGGRAAAAAAAPMPVGGPVIPGLAPDPDLYDRITQVIEQPARTDAATVGSLERCLDEHRRIEDTIGYDWDDLARW